MYNKVALDKSIKAAAMQQKIVALQEQREAYKLLFIEDNDGLRKNVKQLVEKFFNTIYLAKDGLEGFTLFKEHEPEIVITDIRMPKMDGLTLAGKIRTINPKTKVIILSAYDQKEYLHQAIRHNVFRYINKPAKVTTMVDTLYETQAALKADEHYNLFQNQLQDVFNYQNHLVMMLENDKPVLVNQRFLEFFGIDNLPEFLTRHPSLDPLLLEHNGFLYSTEEEGEWYGRAKKETGKLFHTKITNHQEEHRHLILKLQHIPHKQQYTILSLDDITELNLLMLYDSKTTMEDKRKEAKKTIVKMMQIVKDNHAEVKLHIHYKGLTITNPAVITDAEEDVVLKTTFTELKAAHLVRRIVISSEIFPNDIICESPKHVDFDQQTLTLSKMYFTDRSPTEREFIRLEPESGHSVTLFYKELKVFSETRIVDLSERSVKIRIYALPAGLKVGDDARVSMVLAGTRGPLSINTPATILRIDEFQREFHIVLIFSLSDAFHTQLRNYLADRQMALIREFKALDVTTR